MFETPLREEIDGALREYGAERVAVALYDYQTQTGWSCRAEHWFHAASTIKIAVLAGVFSMIHEDRLSEFARLHVRNYFRSAADGSPFRVDSARDADPVVHRNIGKTMRIQELALHMIATSSNLATNLLLDYTGVERCRAALHELGAATGVELVRGVEDEKAFEAGISNRTTAAGLLQLLRVIAEKRAFSEEHSERMLDILHAQEFDSGIPAGLPDDAEVAHKTGEISTVTHDAGVVFLPERKPYVLVILTEYPPEAESSHAERRAGLARVSRLIHDLLAANGEVKGG
ncbi:MAG: serine hydrolase [Longimicrobiaceae bacterium]